MALKPTPDITLDLVRAIITSSNVPLLLLDGSLGVVAASASFCRAFHLHPDGMSGRHISDLGQGEWRVAQLRSLLMATAAGKAEIDAYEMDLRRPGQGSRRLVVNARKLAYSADADVRLLVAVTDVTDARLAEALSADLLRDKEILLQELQHRVANSLQIIASVLLQSARRVQSDETRSHLQAAHQRVMSVAALQKQLAVSKLDDVKLRTYFDELCATIGASMIRDHNHLSLEVYADDSVVSADISVSLGLIVTELVINALKHAFPNDLGGQIKVGYASHGQDWTLSVNDNGVGIGRDRTAIKPGLGTSIVSALARQLGADVEIADGHPGTVVSVVHRDKAAARPVLAVI